MIILFILLGLTFILNTLTLAKFNKEIKSIIISQVKHEEILKKLEEKRENFKLLQEEIERIKIREQIENQYQKIENISINPIGFKTSSVGDLLEHVNNVYESKGIGLKYEEIIKIE